MLSAKQAREKMAISTCIKCGEQKFEIALIEQTGSASTLNLVQCAYCGTPVGVIDPDLPNRVKGLERLITSIDNRLTAIAKALTDLN
jgi:hypothetical protein